MLAAELTEMGNMTATSPARPEFLSEPRTRGQSSVFLKTAETKLFPPPLRFKFSWIFILIGAETSSLATIKPSTIMQRDLLTDSDKGSV